VNEGWLVDNINRVVETGCQPYFGVNHGLKGFPKKKNIF